ncbi:hypothetical protein J2X65_003598 [Ancylobacter sp. 3268]|nr:hypothetical protein [Ancylobacter sp. 3268]
MMQRNAGPSSGGAAAARGETVRNHRIDGMEAQSSEFQVA